ncbi:TIGR02680 family protein [Lacrimispora sp.]|uniref:TIGR02680 family protein n=1 Tax=Lacrimispora sp. TaxID=2719234 RepID=UPI003460047D
MQTSKWMINRIGLIDFWYYDEEEFYFREGRLLLKGANGSGKSVTMQSFIPLLLDGNKAAERLDPFGTRARKLENYLLEENDGREERTGYLYMEFKRRDSNSYVTIGIGLCARRNKKLDSWHFILRDGRRVGHDFFLYKELKNKITLSKAELVNRLGEGGQVIEGQNDYMKLVNDTLFGYENVEEYKELVDLLIQLRTPKLSKDFKPTVLNEILSGSLSPLSDEDLRPMSEAIENMDHLKTRLTELEASKKAADRINEVYQQYNRAVLYEKADHYQKAGEQHGRYEEEYVQTCLTMAECERERQNEVSREEALNIERTALQQKKERLDSSDISRLMEQKLEAEQKLVKAERDFEEKKKSLAEKEEKDIQLHYSLKEQRGKLEQQGEEIAGKLDDMEAGLQFLTFDEHVFMADELKSGLSSPYSFHSLREQMGTIRRDIDLGTELLDKRQRITEKQEDILVQLEKLRQEQQSCVLLKRDQEEQSRQVKSEWEEAFYRWIRSNTLLLFSPEQERFYTGRIRSYGMLTNQMEAREVLREQRDVILGGLQRRGLELEHQGSLEQAEYEEKLGELEEWRNKKDPEPEKEDSVAANRLWLKEHNIPYYPFYKVVDFAGTLDEDKRNRLEEALYCMGILDAVFVPGNYEKQVLALRPGMRDTYIFGDVYRVKESIARLLEVSDEIDDIVFHQELAGVLGAVAVASEGQTWIDEEGRFGLGLLKGTITHSYKARFIGVRAREAYRRSKLGELEKELELLSEKWEQTKQNLEENRRAVARLEEEYSGYPSEADVWEAVRELSETEERLQKLQKETEEKELVLSALKKDLQEIGFAVAENSRKLYLKAELSVYKGARDEASAYYDSIGSLELLHHSYLHSSESLGILEERLEELQDLLEEIRYDINKQNRELLELGTTISACEEQLKARDYDSVREQLEACIQRLAAIPEELKDCYLKQRGYEKDYKYKEDRKVALEQLREKSRLDLRLAERGLMDEKELSYVEGVSQISWENPPGAGAALCRLLQSEHLKSSGELSSLLQQKFYENLSELIDFNLTIRPLFGSEEYSDYEKGNMEPDFKRLAIFAKYKGREVSYDILRQGIEGDVEIQKSLVKESDRALFEDILANTISKKIRYKIYKSEVWVDKMNRLMGSMNTSSGLKLSLVWKKKKAEEEGQLDTRDLVELLKKDAGLMREEELEQLSLHFQTKVQEARRIMEDTGSLRSFHAVMKEVLDYRKWFEFQLFYQKTGENRKELTNNAFFTFSGGEKAMSMYVPLFSAVVAKYDGARADAPRLVSLDEAFAGVDEQNISDMFRLMVDMEFEFIINSQILWGDCDTVPELAIYQLLRKENAKFVTVLPYIWNGKVRKLAEDGEMEWK